MIFTRRSGALRARRAPRPVHELAETPATDTAARRLVDVTAETDRREDTRHEDLEPVSA